MRLAGAANKEIARPQFDRNVTLPRRNAIGSRLLAKRLSPLFQTLFAAYMSAANNVPERGPQSRRPAAPQ